MGDSPLKCTSVKLANSHNQLGPPPLPLTILDHVGKKEEENKLEEAPREVPADFCSHNKDISMSQAVLARIRHLPGNDRCCDCGVARPKWASITLSSLVCIKCASAHHSLGVEQSRIKSLELDSWSTPEIVRMLAGGNARLQAALRSQPSVTGESLSMYTLHARYVSDDAADYTCALNFKCGQQCEIDEDEPPGFGQFLLERAWQLRVNHMFLRKLF